MRVRYLNTLPPPPCPQKLLDIPTPINKYTSTGFISELVNRMPLNVEMDSELGIPIDLSLYPRAFIDETSPWDEPSRELDAKDIALLKQPENVNARSQNGVSFLRRTEYIAGEAVRDRKSGIGLEAQHAVNAVKQSTDFSDPQKQLETVLKTFEDASQDLSALKHPTKKGLHVVDSWEVLPNFELVGNEYINIKLTGPPSIKEIRSASAVDERLEAALVRPTSTADGTDQWLAYYLPDADTTTSLKRKYDQTKEDGQFVQDNYEYHYQHIRDYDSSMPTVSQPFDNISLTFGENGALYSSVNTRFILRRRRAGKMRMRDDDELISAIDLKMREPTEEELLSAKVKKAEFDPLRFELTAEDRALLEPPEAKTEVEADGDDAGSNGVENGEFDAGNDEDEAHDEENNIDGGKRDPESPLAANADTSMGDAEGEPE